MLQIKKVGGNQLRESLVFRRGFFSIGQKTGLYKREDILYLVTAAIVLHNVIVKVWINNHGTESVDFYDHVNHSVSWIAMMKLVVVKLATSMISRMSSQTFKLEKLWWLSIGLNAIAQSMWLLNHGMLDAWNISKKFSKTSPKRLLFLKYSR